MQKPGTAFRRSHLDRANSGHQADAAIILRATPAQPVTAAKSGDLWVLVVVGRDALGFGRLGLRCPPGHAEGLANHRIRLSVMRGPDPRIDKAERILGPRGSLCA